MGVAAKTTKKIPAKDGKAPKSKEVPAVSSAKPPTKSSHPATSEMVNAAIGALKERKGSSVQAIKKYISGNYIVDVERLSPFIKKYLKLAVEKNILVQTTGVGATGRFKLSKTGAVEKSVKPVSGKEAKKTSTASKKPQSEKVKMPSKAKKSGKAPAAKTKSPKPKKVRAN